MRRDIPPTSPIVRIAFPFLVFFLAAIFSGILEKMPFLAPFHILMLIGGLALILVGLGGRLPVVLLNPIGLSLAAFTAWFMVCIPFAVWPGGSFNVLLDPWSRSFLSFLLVAGCVLTIDQCKTIFKTIGYSVGVLSIITLALRGHDNTGRLGLVDTRYQNANDLAWTLVFGLPFLGFLILRGNRTEKIFALFFSVPILLALVKTGSRASMVGLGVLMLIGFLQASRALKLKLAFGVPIVLALLMAVTPAEMRARFTTIFGSGENYEIGRIYLTAEQHLIGTATASAEERWMLTKDAVYLTLIHPVFGVGPGDFQVAQNDLSRARGQARGAWRVTHNTYVGISSEMGMPGFVIYLVFLYQCVKPLNWIVRSKYPGKDWQDLRALAMALRAAFFAMGSIMLFGSFGYDTAIPMMAGLACALSLIAQRQRALMTAPAQQVTPTPAGLAEPALEPAWTSF